MRVVLDVCRMRLLPVPLIALAACSGAPPGNLGKACSDGLANAYSRLNKAKAEGLSGKVDWSKAASLLAAAKVQEQFEKYPNCIDKVRRANYYISRAGGG